MSINNKLLREGIISKLKEYNAYVDNELPDYIMVMLANKKTVHQINNDLQLFLGEHTDVFTSWLQKVLTNQDLLLTEVEGTKEETDKVSDRSQQPLKEEAEPIVIGSKRLRSADDDDPPEIEKHSPAKVAKTTAVEESKKEIKVGTQSRSKLKLDQSEGQRSSVRKVIRIIKPDQDLREFIALRRSDKERKRVELEDADDQHPSSTVASVVKLVERPHHSDAGGSRLLHRAILGIKPERKKAGLRERSGHKRTTSGEDKVEVVTRSRGKIATTEHQAATSTIKDVDKPNDHGGHQLEEEEEEDDEEGEVIVEVEGDEGTRQEFVDEFREEQQVDQATQKRVEELALAAVKKVLPKSSRIRVISGNDVSSKTREGEDEDDENADLRDLLNRTKKEKTRFILTLSEAGDSYDQITTVKPKVGGVKERVGGGVKERVGGVKERLGLEKVLLSQEDNQEDMEADEDYSAAAGGGLPERCRFWPNCKNGDTCPYHHPTVPCNLFPNCKYGKKCLFVHPQCKFDSRCMRADCPYLHTAPKHISFQPQAIPPVMQAPVAPVAPMFTPPYNPASFSFSRSPSSAPWSSGRPSSKYPNKSALTWTPSKVSHLSERKYAVPEDQTSSLIV